MLHSSGNLKRVSKQPCFWENCAVLIGKNKGGGSFPYEETKRCWQSPRLEELHEAPSMIAESTTQLPWSAVEWKTRRSTSGNLTGSLKCQDETGMAIEGETHWSLLKERLDRIKAFFQHKGQYPDTEQMGGLRLQMKKWVKTPSYEFQGGVKSWGRAVGASEGTRPLYCIRLLVTSELDP